MLIVIIENSSQEYVKRLLDAVFEDPNSFIAILDKKGNIKRVNKTALDFIGHLEEELIGKKFWNTPWWDHSSELQDNLKKNIKKVGEGNFVRFDAVNYSHEGDRINIDVTLRPVFDDKGDVNDIIAEGRDITEIKDAESKLKKSKQKIEELHKISADIEDTSDEKEILDIAIDAAKTILGMESSEIMIKEGERLVVKSHSIDIEDLEPLDMDVDEGIAGKTYENQRSYLVKNIQEEDDASPSYKVYRSGISIPIGRFGVFQALSTEVDYFDEEDLELAELLISHVKSALDNIKSKEKETFLLTLLRHDLKNKNQITRGYIEMLDSPDIDDEERTEILSKALDSIESSERLINKVGLLKDINREEERKMELGPVINNAVKSYDDILQDKDIKINIDIDRYTVIGGRLMEDLFENIIENAVKHSDCGLIRISTEEKDGDVLVTIEDDGVGIPVEDKNKILDKGFRREGSNGLGIGMYLVKNIAENYHGLVDVKESELGGARFDITFKKA